MKDKTWHKRYRAMLKYYNWGNKDIAKITGLSLNSVKNLTSPAKMAKSFSGWLKLAIVLHENLSTELEESRDIEDDFDSDFMEAGE